MNRIILAAALGLALSAPALAEDGSAGFTVAPGVAGVDQAATMGHGTTMRSHRTVRPILGTSAIVPRVDIEQVPSSAFGGAAGM